MLSCPPATTIAASPAMIDCAPTATARRPEPQTWFKPQAGTSCGTPAAIEAWRAGFWPCAAVSTWPRMTSETRSEEHTSELQSLMRISYAVFCLKTKKQTTNNTTQATTELKHTNNLN